MVATGTILIADDDADILSLLQATLRDHFSTILLAADGREALTLHENHKVDVILCDLRMPEMSGLEFLGELRRRGDEVPFLILTGFPETDSAVQALRLGAFDFLIKPFDPGSILLKIQVAMAQRGLMADAENDVKKLIAEGKLPGDMGPERYAAARHVAYLRRVKSTSR